MAAIRVGSQALGPPQLGVPRSSLALNGEAVAWPQNIEAKIFSGSSSSSILAAHCRAYLTLLSAGATAGKGRLLENSAYLQSGFLDACQNYQEEEQQALALLEICIQHSGDSVSALYSSVFIVKAVYGVLGTSQVADVTEVVQSLVIVEGGALLLNLPALGKHQLFGDHAWLHHKQLRVEFRPDLGSLGETRSVSVDEDQSLSLRGEFSANALPDSVVHSPSSQAKESQGRGGAGNCSAGWGCDWTWGGFSSQRQEQYCSFRRSHHGLSVSCLGATGTFQAGARRLPGGTGRLKHHQTFCSARFPYASSSPDEAQDGQAIASSPGSSAPRWGTGSHSASSESLPDEGLAESDGKDNVLVHLAGLTSHASSAAPPPERPLDVFIHPSAWVHPDAILMEGVEIGAMCTVGPAVKLGPGCKLHPASHVFGNTELGASCTLLSGAVVGADLPGTTILGANNSIGHHAVVGVKCQDMKYKEGSPCFLTIGSNNDIREHVSIHRSSKPDDCTVVGDNNLIMGSCHVAHDCKMGDRNILANGTLLGGHVVVEDLIHTGGAVAVHQFCHLGAYSFLAGGSMVVRDVPVYTMVAGDRAELRGLNLEGMRRCGFSDEEVKSIRKAYQKLFMSSDHSLGLEDRLTKLEHDETMCASPVVRRLLSSVRSSFGEHRRGICKFRHWTSAD